MELIAPLQIPVRKTSRSLLKEVDWDNLEFGKYSTDQMLVCDYSGGKWGSPQILPFGDFSLSPSALGLHYGQTVFEGMKAFRQADGRINIFRPRKHYERLERSAERLCMPAPSWEIFSEGLRQLVELDRDWVPTSAGGALYIRPFIIATEARLGVKISDAYRFAIVCTPSGPLYPQPIRVKVEKDFVRAARGGTGYAKCGGNYGAAFYPARKAKEEGYDQVLWTDGKENRFIEESGTMNVLFVLNRKLVTPPLSDSILDGVTRDSLFAIAKKDGITVEERPVSIEELELAFGEGTITEAFGAGTAAVVSPIRTIGIGGVDHDLPSGGKQSLALSLRARLDDIRYGKEADPFGWNYIV
ncbi:MAG TPA: branched-chain amino acid aminotransferase [Puia sp.]|nr:branched-chain amino acid aminotransferase [Puia sp.]